MTSGSVGAEVQIKGEAVSALFAESQSRFIVTINPENRADFEAVIPEAKQIGLVTDTAQLVIKVY